MRNKKGGLYGMLILAIIGFIIGTLLVKTGILFDTTGVFIIQFFIGIFGIILAIIMGFIGLKYLSI